MTSFLNFYFNRRQAAIFLLGFSSGLPLPLGFSTLSYWLSTENTSLVKIGGLLLTSLPYSLKFLWSPFIDHVRVPFLTSLLGLRRAWLILTQALLFFSLVALGASQPQESLFYLSLTAFLLAFFSASQDIVVDAYRIEVLTEREQGVGASMTQAGYRLGMLVSGAGALALSSFLDWFEIYFFMASLMLIGGLGTLIAPPIQERRSPSPSFGSSSVFSFSSRFSFFKQAFWEPFFEFIQRKVWWAILLFVLLYKYGDATAGAMANPFYHQMGFTGLEIAGITKGIGVVSTMIGVFLGGSLVVKRSLFFSLLIGGVFQALTNLIFAYMATQETSLFWLSVAILSDNMTGGIGTSVFVAYLSLLCHKNFTATQYALLSAVTSFGRVLMASGSGWLAEALGWPLFFVSTTFLALPGLGLLLFLRRRSFIGSRP